LVVAAGSGGDCPREHAAALPVTAISLSASRRVTSANLGLPSSKVHGQQT
jgi:hypothetical protein